MQRAQGHRVQGGCLVGGGIVALGCNLALPSDDDDFGFVEMVGNSDAWPWLHLGLFVAVALIMVGLHGLVDLIRADRPHLASVAAGSLLVGGGFMLSGLVVAGVALRKAADNVLFVLREHGPGPDLSGSFYSALGFDRLSYALYAAAAILLLGMLPIAIGLGLLRGGHRSLGVAGVIAGTLSVATGVAELTLEVGTSELYLVSSAAVTAWVIVSGLILLKGHTALIAE